MPIYIVPIEASAAGTVEIEANSVLDALLALGRQDWARLILGELDGSVSVGRIEEKPEPRDDQDQEPPF